MALARALGAFHNMTKRLPPRSPAEVPDCYRPVRTHAQGAIDDFRRWLTDVMPTAQSTSDCTASSAGSLQAPFPGFDSAVDSALLKEMTASAEYIVEHRAEAIDALPAYWLHGDFQAKNVMCDQSTRTLTVIDTTDMLWASRCYDFYFLLASEQEDGEDFDKHFITTLFVEYFRAGGPLLRDLGHSELCGNEVFLMTNCLQLKALGESLLQCNTVTT